MRWPRDWSSDVCSSDLKIIPQLRIGFVHFLVDFRKARKTDFLTASSVGNDSLFLVYFLILSLKFRSEERRVGKECRSEWWTYLLEKKGNRPCGEWGVVS